MSTPFINPYEVKDVVSTSLNNLDQQTTDLISSLDGFFSSEISKDKEIIADNGSLETLKPIKIKNSQGAFWDKGTTYYFQPIAERLKVISDELQGKLNLAENLKQHIQTLFNNSMDTSAYKLQGYETLFNNVDKVHDSIYNPANTTLDNFFKQIRTSSFNMMTRSEVVTDNIFEASQFMKVEFDANDVAALIDDGDNFFNDNPTLDDPTTIGENEALNEPPMQQEFYLVQNIKMPVFSKFTTSDSSELDDYNYVNQRIDPDSPLWKGGTYDTPDKVLFGMTAIALTSQKAIAIFPPIDSVDSPTEKENKIRRANERTMQAAERSLAIQTKEYLEANLPWYNSPNRIAPDAPAPPPFPLAKSHSGTITYATTDYPFPSYGGFKPDDTDNMFDLIREATGLNFNNDGNFKDLLDNWDDPDRADDVKKLTEYYAQSYMNYSITSTFAAEEPSLATKNLFLHNVLSNKTNEISEYQGYWIDYPHHGKFFKLLNFERVLSDMVPTDYLRGETNQMLNLADLFLENFDITANRYIEDNRTLVDCLSGKLNKNQQSNLDNILFQSISDAVQDISSQAKSTLSRGLSNTVMKSQFTLDIVNQTSVRKEDYGLSPVPGTPGENFFPDNYNKERFLPAHYYYDSTNLYTPRSTTHPDEAQHTFNPSSNGLPSDFPVMDIRDFDEFFKVIKNELGALLGKEPVTDYPTWTDTDYPTWTDTGFGGTANSVFGSPLSDENKAKVNYLYDSLTKIIENMEDRVSTMESTVKKIPRPRTYSRSDGTTVNLNSTVPGYGDQPTLELVRIFLEEHNNTKPAAGDPRSREKIIFDQISSLVNTFNDVSKFSQNNAFEAVYAGEVFEAGKHNEMILNAKKPDPRPDGTMPEEKGVPKPLLSALSSSLTLTTVGQIISEKVNDIIATDKVNSISNIQRDLAGNISSLQMTGSAEGQTYINNILKQISEIASTGNIKMDLSSLTAQVSMYTETGILDLRENTDNDNYKMIYIDESILDELIVFENILNQFNPYPSDQFLPHYEDPRNEELISMKTLLYEVDLNDLKSKVNEGNGYSHYLDLSGQQRILIDAIRDGVYRVNSTATGGAPRLEVKKVDPVTSAVTYEPVIPDDTRPVEVKFDLLTNLQTFTSELKTTLKPMINIWSSVQDAYVQAIRTIDGTIAEKEAIDNNTTRRETRGFSYTPKTFSDGNNYLSRAATVSTRAEYKTVPAGVRVIAPDITIMPAYETDDEYNARKAIERQDWENWRDTNGPALKKRALDDLNEFKVIASPLSDFARPGTQKYEIYHTIVNADIDFQALTEMANADNDISLGVGDVLYHYSSESMSYNAIIESPLATSGSQPDDTAKTARKALLDGILGEAGKTDSLVDIGGELMSELKNVNDAANLFHTCFNISYVMKEYTAVEGKNPDGSVLILTPSVNEGNTGSFGNQFFHHLFNIPRNIGGGPIDPHFTAELKYDDEGYPEPSIGDAVIANATAVDLSGNPVDHDRTHALSFTAPLNTASADSFTLQEIYEDELALQTELLNELADTPENRKLYIRKMQHYSVLFNTLAGGTTEIFPPLTSFRDTVFRSGQNFNLITKLNNPTDLTQRQTLTDYLLSIADYSVFQETDEFKAIAKQIELLAPITDNVNALDVTLAADLKKAKTGAESDLDSTMYLFNEIENQINVRENFLGGIMQIFQQRQIKINPESTNIQDLKNMINISHIAAITAKKELDKIIPGSDISIAKTAASVALDEITRITPTNKGLIPKLTGLIDEINLDIAAHPTDIALADLRLNLEVLLQKAQETETFLTNAKNATDAITSDTDTVRINAAKLAFDDGQIYKGSAMDKFESLIGHSRKIVDYGGQATILEPLRQRDPATSPLTAQDLKKGNYIYKGYVANIDYLDSTKSLTISGTGTSVTDNTRWDIKTMIYNKGFSFPLPSASDISALSNMREFLSAALEVYKDMENSNFTDVKEQLKEYDLWLQNNAISKIGRSSLNGKEALKADIAFIDHIDQGATNAAAGGTAPTGAVVNKFLLDSKDRLLLNSKKAAALNDIRITTTDFEKKMNSGLSADELIAYYGDPTAVPPVLGINRPGGPLAGGILGYESVGLGPGYGQVLTNISTLLGKLKKAEEKENPPPTGTSADCTKEKAMYAVMIFNLLGTRVNSLTAEFIDQVREEVGQSGTVPIYPDNSTLAMNGLTYVNNIPNLSIKSAVSKSKKDLDELIDPEKHSGTVNLDTLKNFTLTSVANTRGLKGKSVQELIILLYIMQMFEQSNWEWEKYLNDSSRYEITE